MQSEKQLEKQLIEQLLLQEYEKVDIKNENQLMNNFKKQLEIINKIEFSEDEFKKIQNYLAGGSIFDKAKKLRDRFELFRDNGEVKYILFLEQEDFSKNIFQVTHQIPIKGKYDNRYDVTILINGLPLVQIELKRKTIQLKTAFFQIERYQRHSFQYNFLFQYIQIFIISNEENTKYFSNNGELRYEFTFSWTDKHNLKKNRLVDFTKSFLDRQHLWKMITKYIVTNETQKSLMILRPYQYYAVEKIIDVVKNSSLNGYIWHTTGSGKTLTSFKASQIISTISEVDKVVFCVDRKDLDYQTAKEFNAFEEGCISKVEDTNEFVQKMIQGNKKVDVDKIVRVYINREKIEKYSKKVSMKEIEKNDYNLNIPRYVDTFEEEEEINIDEIVEKINKITEEMQEVDKTIKSFCDELGIKLQ